jgi:FtsH-binding integral membrane protein
MVFRVFALSPWMPLVILGAFMVTSWIAQSWARSETSIGLQYAGLGLYVVIEALIILPLLVLVYYYANRTGDPLEGQRMIGSAGILTLAVFGGLTATAFTTGKDFSFLGPIVWIGSMIALGVIVAGFLFGFSIGLFFSVAMVALLSASILYETSQVMYHYRTDQHVAAALVLFASVATMFFWILRILLEMNRRN